MKRYFPIVLGVLFAVACDPVPTPPPPTPPSGGDSIIVDTDSVVNNDTIVMPDDTVSVDSLGLMTMDVTFNVADDEAYVEVPEEIITDDTHGDYGDFIENYKAKTPFIITFSDNAVSHSAVPSNVKITKNGAHVEVKADKKEVEIILQGSTSNGSFKLYSEKKMQITLNGVCITNPTGAAINIQSGKTMLMQLADNTVNVLEDGDEYASTGTEQQKGTLFSEGQLVFSGNGALTVKSNYGHGIASDDYVRIRGGEISINSVRDGISTKERFVMYGGTVHVVALQDGLDIDEGYIEIGGGRLTVDAVDEGITTSYEGDEFGNVDPNVDPYINIRGGFVKVSTTGDKGHGLRAMSTLSMSGGIVQVSTLGAGSKALLSEGDMSFTGGKVTAITEGDALYEDDADELSSSAAVRSKGTLTMNGMVVGLKSTGSGSKGVNNVGDVVLRNSSVKIVAIGEDHVTDYERARPYAINTDGKLSVSGGSLLIKTTRTPIKATTMQIADDVVYGAVTLEN